MSDAKTKEPETVRITITDGRGLDQARFTTSDPEKSFEEYTRNRDATGYTYTIET